MLESFISQISLEFKPFHQNHHPLIPNHLKHPPIKLLVIVTFHPIFIIFRLFVSILQSFD